MEESPLRLIGYVRVSTMHQADGGRSLEAQRENIESYCKLYGCELVRVETDPGHSAKNLKRPALQRALGAIAAGEAEGLIVTTLDRLTRNVWDMGDLLRGPLKEVELISVTDKLDTSSPTGRLIMKVLLSFSEWEREMASRRTKRVLAFKRDKGERVGNLPYGYRLSDDDVHIEPDPEEQEVLHHMQRLRDAGKSWAALTRWLNEHGFLNRHGRKWSYQNVQKCIKEPEEWED